MITIKIRRLDEDPDKPKKNRGSAADERAALAALAKKNGIGFSQQKMRAKRPGRGVPGGKGKSAARARHQHLKDFSDQAEYLLEGNEKGEHKDGEGRVEDAFALGSPVAVDGASLSPEQVREVGGWMGEGSALNTRMKNSAALHYVIGLPPEETHRATPEFWRMVAPRLLKELDLEDHAALCVVHCDTNHKHMHIVVNRVHPTTYMAKSPWQDLVKLEQLNYKIEKELGLRVVPGRLIDKKTGEKYTVEQIIDGARPPKRGPKGGASEFKKIAMERLKAEKPFSNSTSWRELESKLKPHGYHLRHDGGGMMLVDTELAKSAHGKNAAIGKKRFYELKVSAVAGKGNGGGALEQRFDQKWADYQADKVTAAEQGVSTDEAAAQRVAESQRHAELQQAQLGRQARDKKEAQRRKIEMLLKGKGVWFGKESNEEQRKIGGQPTDGYEFRQELSEQLTDDQLRFLHQKTVTLRDHCQTEVKRLRSLPAAQQDADDGWIGEVGMGARDATEFLQIEAKRRGIDLTLQTATVVATPKAEPLEIDPDDKPKYAVARKLLMGLSEKDLRVQYAANKFALETVAKDIKKKGVTPDLAGKKLALKEGVLLLNGVAKERGIVLSKKRSIKKTQGHSM